MSAVAASAPDVALVHFDLFTRNASSLAALVLVICEYLRNFEDEVQYIWRWPLNRVKYIYLISRYISLGGLAANCAALLVGPLATPPHPVHYCRGWFSGLTFVSCFVLFAIDAVAMLRVYALYNRNARIGAFFASLLLTEATLVTTCTSTTVGIVPFTPICDVAKTPWQVLYFTCGVLATQLSLTFFTFKKRKAMAGQRQIPIIKLVFREGTWMSTLVFCIFMFIVPYSLITGTSKPHIVLIWPTSLLSNAVCRVILNMHRIPSPGRSLRSPTIGTDADIQFTSFFMSDNVSASLRREDLSHHGSLGLTFDAQSLPDTDSLSFLSLGGRTTPTPSVASSVSIGIPPRTPINNGPGPTSTY
ncbi:hypothetical protein FA15DRAFT_593431 [Coprinopsis marcescibilis]|uniref:DUF6533 domain-containing protein n=1 Tax=Coprinopsis marcescibilis TaxID=230819 RepID=A0A5C3L6Q5_COPMA|nr:hypothetical protein FA15DRAFT_593431 [Coprinopsis marcescibilis]